MPTETQFPTPCYTNFNDEVTFYADTGHFYLSKGITHINGVPVSQDSLLNEQNPAGSKEPLSH